MKRKAQSFQEKYVCSRPESELKKMQLTRLICILGALALFIVSLLIKQGALSKLVASGHKLSTSIQTVYMVLVFAILLLSLYTLVCSLTRYKIAKEILACNAPKKGFAEGTWPSFIWTIVLVVLYAALTVGLMIYKFSVGSLIVLLLALCSGVLYYLAMDTGKRAYRGTTTLLADTAEGEKKIAELIHSDDAPDDFYEE